MNSMEQKAKAYDEALEKARKRIATEPQDHTDAILKDIFPQLRESEDERIRKEIISFIQDDIDRINCRVSGDYDDRDEDDIKHQNWCKKAIAYLEKQKERPKSADSIPSDCTEDAKCDDRSQKHNISVDEIAQDYVDGVKEYNPEPTWDLMQTAVCYGYHYCEQKEQKPSINIDQLKSLMLQYLQEAANEKDDSAIEADTDKWARKILGYDFKQKRYDFEQKPAESISHPTVQGKGVYKICPRCKERMVRDDSKVYTSMPSQYGYECPKCGEIEFDTAMYDNPEMEEQKPVDDKAFEEWIDGWYNEHHRDGYVTMDEREFKNFCRGIRNMYQQKPAEWSKDIIRKGIKEVGLTQHQIDWLKSNVFSPKR